MWICSVFSLLYLLQLFSRADSLFGYALLHCQFTSPDDVFYLEQIFFNKVLMIQYNSTLGKYIGFTKKAEEIAADLNKAPAFLKEEKKNEEKCKKHTSWAFDVLSKPVEPSVSLKSVEAMGRKHPNMLLCSAYNFFPKQIRVTWLRNGKEVTSDVTSTDELSNGNWLYQIHTYLEYTPTPGENISCMVEHASLVEPKLYGWRESEDLTPESERNKIAVGTSGLLLGLVFLLIGLIYCKRNTHGRVLVPTVSQAAFHSG